MGLIPNEGSKAGNWESQWRPYLRKPVVFVKEEIKVFGDKGPKEKMGVLVSNENEGGIKCRQGGESYNEYYI